MKQGHFESLHGDVWRSFERILDQLDDKKNKARIDDIEKFSHLYRRVCHYHALAKDRNYSSYLVDQLGELITRGHQYLYQRKQHFTSAFIRFFVVVFPCLVRKEYKLFWLATALLYLPAIILGLSISISPELVYTVMDPFSIQQYEEMYNPENRTLGSARDSETNWSMFGYYINNNIGVAFRTFASGLLWGVGSIFFLFYNGLVFGAVAGHLVGVGYAETFFTFVIAHGSVELTAIVIAGAAGLKLGLSLLYPGNLSRVASLKQAADVAIQLIYGVIFFLLLAAFIEAFWSSNNVFLPWQKYLVGAVLWALVIAYLSLSGRRGESR